MDDHVVAELHLGNVGETGLLADAAEIDAGHLERSVVADLDHLAGNAEAHVEELLVAAVGRPRRIP